jgi:hypothetical protein
MRWPNLSLNALMRASFGESLRDHPFMTIEIMNNYSCSFPMHPNKKEIEWYEEVARPVVCQSMPNIIPTEQIRSKIPRHHKANAFPSVINPNSKAGGIIKSGG